MTMRLCKHGQSQRRRKSSTLTQMKMKITNKKTNHKGHINDNSNM